jgi:hypothetical protein
MESKRQYFERRLGSLKQERASFEAHWRELSDYILARSSRFFTSDRNKGDRRNQKIINDTATHAARTLSSGMMGGLTSPARPWFALRTEDPVLNESKPVKVWLDLVRQRMSDVFLRSNIYQALPTLYEEVGTFSVSAFALMEDEDTVIRAYPAPIGSYCLGVSHRGAVDTFVREFQMTQRQLVAKFGKENCSTRVQQGMADNRSQDVWVDVVHVVEPNPEHDPEHPSAKKKPFRSIYYERGGDADGLLSESGFDEFPIMTARWAVTGEDTYGTACPGMQALGDIKALQLGEKRKWEAIDKLVRPPLGAPSALRNSTVTQIPGGITYFDVSQGQQGVRPLYEINPHLAELDAMLRQIERRIERAYFADLFLMMSGLDQAQPITAAEVMQRKEEKMLMLGPVLERLNDELFDPLIKRTFGIMLRRGMIPPPPEEMQGASLSVEYISILAQAQKLVGVAALEKLTVYIGNLMSAFPDAADRFDADQAIEEYGSMVGAGPKVIRDAKEAAQIRQARAQKMQAQEAMAAMQQGAQTAQTLGKTPITDDNALGAMLQRMGGGAA